MRTLPLRTFAVTTTVLALVLLYLLWWTTYAGVHFEQRYDQLAPGAPGRSGGTTVQLLSLISTARLADQEYGGDPELAEPGTVWAVAELEGVRLPGSPAFDCPLELLGPDGRRWEAQFQTRRTLPACDGDALSGRPTRFEMIYLVPVRFADSLMGVALLDPTVADRVPVLVPPG